MAAIPTQSSLSIRSLAIAFCLVAVIGVAAAESGRQVAIRGTMNVIQEDDFEHGRTARIHNLIDDATGIRYTLRFARMPDEKLRTGDRVVARGLAVGREIHLESLDPASLQVVESADAPALEARRAIVIVTNFSDSAVACSDASVASLMFTGASSVDGLYQAASFGKVSVPGDTDGNGQPDVIRVTIANSITEACDAYGWAAAAESAAQAAGVDLGLYQHRVIVLPSNATCSWAGLGNVGCGTWCRAWVKNCNLQDVYAHEIGHNLDMAHSSTDTNNDGTIDCEYCDKSDFMGYGGVGWRIVNAPHENQKQWMPSAKIQEVSVAGTANYVLSPLQADPSMTPYPQVLKVQRPSTGDWYYLSYRQRQGYDATLSSEYVDRTSIHRYVGSGYSNTRFIVALQDGQVFDDAQGGMSFRQVSHDATSVTLQITTSCSAASPSVVLTPARQSALPGAELRYTATVTNRDPSMCDSSTFDLSASAPAGFSVSLSSSSLMLAPGAQGSVTLSAISAAGSADGDFALSVAANDPSATVHHGSAQAVYAVDGTAPSAVVTLAASVGRKNVVNLSWSASTDAGSGVSTYRVFRNGAFLASTASTSYQDRTATTAGTYSYTVLALDGVGNVSGPGNIATVTVGSSGGGKGGRPR